jgi:hypothetical protein
MNTWILLTHQIPQNAPNLRVKIWRSLKKHGAVLFKNSVYVLPYTKEHEEIMQWLCKEIKDNGGDASVFITKSSEKKQDEEIIRTFNEARDKEYLPLIESCDDIGKAVEKIEETEGVTDYIVDEFRKKLNEMMESMNDVVRVDFFHTPQGKILSKKIELVQQRIKKWSKKIEQKETVVTHRVYKIKDFSGKKWVTRKDIYIDRLASAWLIRRFIDPHAKFIFVSKSDEKLPKNAIPFDMYGAEFTHHGDDCTFETLIKSFVLKDQALHSLAEIIHDIDLKDNKYNRKEAEGIVQVITGLSLKLNDDNKLLEKGMEIFDALYYSCATKTKGGR